MSVEKLNVSGEKQIARFIMTFTKRLHTYNFELRTARQSFYGSIAKSNNNDTHALFAVVIRQSNPPMSGSL